MSYVPDLKWIIEQLNEVQEMVKQRHVCNKEDDINEIKIKLGKIYDRVDVIYCKLMGNGRPGMFSEFDQWKGAVKIMGWVIGGGTLVTLGLTLFFHFYT